MLIACPECSLQVSDKAYACPHCGYPMKKTSDPRRPKRNRLPNGFGQISMIKHKNLRRPYRAMVTVRKNEFGRPICKTIGYYETYNDAYYALTEYQKTPYDVEQDMTMAELYERWSEEKYKGLADNTVKGLKASWKLSESMGKIRVRDLHTRHIKSVLSLIDSPNIKQRTKIMLSQMIDYAMELEIVSRNCVDLIKNEQLTVQQGHSAFNSEEISMLWNHSGDKAIDMILVQIYTGLRPQELCSIRNENIHSDYIIAGMKTKAGKDRYVPIHSKIAGIISKYKSDRELLFGMGYNYYYTLFNKAMSDLGLEKHRPHDPRKTFVTLAKKYQLNEYAIKYIAGHAINDITERTYTEREPKWLNSEIEKIN